MQERAPIGRRRFLVIVFLSGAACINSTQGQWPQWGGPNRNFTVETEGLADEWPEEGPKKLWHRALGDGYSAIVVERPRLYTMYRRGDEEVVISLDASTGKTLWEHAYNAKVIPEPYVDTQHGTGPNATPLLIDDHIYTMGFTAKLHCLNKTTGEIVWFHDLIGEYAAPMLYFGHSASPVRYKGTVIVLAGGPGQSVMAFDLKDGSVVWKSQTLAVSYASPIIVTVEGEDQLVALVASEVVGLDPRDGRLLWRHAHENQYKSNLSTPVWDGQERLFISNYGAGSRGLQLTRAEGRTTVSELWYQRKMQIAHSNAIRIGDFLYGASVGFIAAINLKTGEIAWRERSPMANFVYTGRVVIFLKENGRLGLGELMPHGLSVHAECQIAEPPSWTVPTLVGTRLYVRDKKNVMALDLGPCEIRRAWPPLASNAQVRNPSP